MAGPLAQARNMGPHLRTFAGGMYPAFHSNQPKRPNRPVRLGHADAGPALATVLLDCLPMGALFDLDTAIVFLNR